MADDCPPSGAEAAQTPVVPDTDALIALLIQGGSSAAKVRATLRERQVVVPAQVVSEFLRGPGARSVLLGTFVAETGAILGAEPPVHAIARYLRAGLQRGDAGIAASAHENRAVVVTFDKRFARRLRRLDDPVILLTHD